MGQQQLLLLVLGMVIVGIAVVAGIQAFSEGKEKAARDAAVSDAMRIISDIQAWKMKPAAFGGGASSNNIPTFYDLGYPKVGILEDSKYKTVNGCYEISNYTTPPSGSSGSSGSSGIADLKIYLDTGCSGSPIAVVHIGGTTVDDLQWEWKSTS